MQLDFKENILCSFTMTSEWARWCLKSPASPLFTQSFIQARSKKTSNLRVTGLRVGNSPETGEFPAQMASNAENVSIWWRHHAFWNSESRFRIWMSNSFQNYSWWRNDMEMLFALLALCEGNPPVTSGFPSQRASNVVLGVSLNKLLNKQSGYWWFETPWSPKGHRYDKVSKPRDLEKGQACCSIYDVFSQWLRHFL